LHLQAFATLGASPGALAYYDTLRGRKIGHHAALRQLRIPPASSPVLRVQLRATTLTDHSSVGSRRLKVFRREPTAFSPRLVKMAVGSGVGIVAFGDHFRGAVASSIRAVRNREAARVAETMRKPAAAATYAELLSGVSDLDVGVFSR